MAAVTSCVSSRAAPTTCCGVASRPTDSICRARWLAPRPAPRVPPATWEPRTAVVGNASLPCRPEDRRRHLHRHLASSLRPPALVPSMIRVAARCASRRNHLRRPAEISSASPSSWRHDPLSHLAAGCREQRASPSPPSSRSSCLPRPAPPGTTNLCCLRL
jgi:hypothetical protein